jgi:hypothetical protein
MKITAESHLDHGLNQEHVAWLIERFADKSRFFLETITLPDFLPEVECALYGPICGDEPVAEATVTYKIRGSRKYASRVLADGSFLPSTASASGTRKTRTLTVIAGPSGVDPCVLYTSYGGPVAPREPGDPGIGTWESVLESRAFWATHALVSIG